jgi:hypothetical protein
LRPIQTIRKGKGDWSRFQLNRRLRCRIVFQLSYKSQFPLYD